MTMFLDYLSPLIPLETRLDRAFREAGIPEQTQVAIKAFLAPLRVKHLPTYEHSIRVGLVLRCIGRFMHLDERALLFAGLLHDDGKCQTDLRTLTKTVGWTPADTLAMRPHPEDGFRLLRGHFDFTAEIIVRHHQFQSNPYPDRVPDYLHDYSMGTKTLIELYARLLALADVYDALHRVNDKFGRLSGLQIKAKLIELNPDLKRLIEDLYTVAVFTCDLYPAAAASESKEPDAHDLLYEQAWSGPAGPRTARETRRLIQLALALEPIADKGGCTTRNRDLNRDQKLTYFITGAINIGDAFEDLVSELLRSGMTPGLYRFALQAQRECKRNRRGGRVNQGIIELLMPIVIAQHTYDVKATMSAEDVLRLATDVLQRTSLDDIRLLREMKRFAFDLSGYVDRPVPDYQEAETVYEYYAQDLAKSVKPTSIAHNGEFFHGFPTVSAVHEALSQHVSLEDAYTYASLNHDPNVANGFLADCIAVGLYLFVSQNRRTKIAT